MAITTIKWTTISVSTIQMYVNNYFEDSSEARLIYDVFHCVLKRCKDNHLLKVQQMRILDLYMDEISKEEWRKEDFFSRTTMSIPLLMKLRRKVSKQGYFKMAIWLAPNKLDKAISSITGFNCSLFSEEEKELIIDGVILATIHRLVEDVNNG